MSGRLVGEVLDHAPQDLTPLELLVLLALAETARWDTRTATYKTSIDQIAERVRAQPGSVKQALFKLRHRGLIVGVFEKPRRGLCQHYRIPKLHNGTERATLKALPTTNPNDNERVTPQQPRSLWITST